MLLRTQQRHKLAGMTYLKITSICQAFPVQTNTLVFGRVSSILAKMRITGHKSDGATMDTSHQMKEQRGDHDVRERSFGAVRMELGLEYA
jgi:hypothetical protein